jgi:hypothetical protein
MRGGTLKNPKLKQTSMVKKYSTFYWVLAFARMTVKKQRLLALKTDPYIFKEGIISPLN